MITRRLVWLSTSMVLVVLVAVAFVAYTVVLGDTEIELAAEDDGAEVRVDVGDEIEIALEGNPTTGYTWAVADAAGGIVELKGEIKFTAQSDLVGAGGMQELEFEAVREGTGELRLIYHRPFEQGVEPLEEFTVTVVV